MTQLAQTQPDIRGRCFFELGSAEQLIKFLLEEDDVMRPVNRKMAREWINTWRTRIKNNNQGASNG